MSLNAFELGDARCAGADRVRTATVVKDGRYAVAATVAAEFPVLDWTPQLDQRYADMAAAVAPTGDPYYHHGIKVDPTSLDNMVL